MATEQRTLANEFTMEGSGAGHTSALTRRPQRRPTLHLPQRHQDRRQDDSGRTLADLLGWFSVGLGLAQIAAPKAVADLIGLQDDRGMMRYLGARELTAGLGVLTQRNQSNWLWGRVAGDVMDLALLASAFGAKDARRDRLVGATAAVMGVTLLDILAAQQRGQAQGRGTGLMRSGIVRSRKTITIDCSPEELYRFWRNFENLPRFMNHLESVQRKDDRRSHWIAKGPANARFEWDAEITEDRPNEYLAWRSVGNADVRNAGNVRFVKAPGDRGTEIHVELIYFPPGGRLGATAAWLMGQAPEQRVQEDLRQLKQLFELGETTTTQGQPSGARDSLMTRMTQLMEREMR
jgi:uncharacterized membrane protein